MIDIGSEPVPGYRILEFLGDGNFGSVYKTTAPGGLLAACKFVPLYGRKGAKELKSLERIKHIRSGGLTVIHGIWLLDANHKPIASVRESLAADGLRERAPGMMMVAMELGDKTLDERYCECEAQNRGGIPQNELLDYMDDLARGVDFLNTPCHDLGDGLVAIQHCDIKPRNIILVGGSAKLCDFGLITLLGSTESTRPGPGTIEYSAPERIFGTPSSTSDQYSLAVTYFRMRTGQLPFHADDRKTEFTIVLAHKESRLDFSGVAAVEEQVLRKATAYEPDKRFEKARDMVVALRECLKPHEAVTLDADALAHLAEPTRDTAPATDGSTIRPLDETVTMPDGTATCPPTTRAWTWFAVGVLSIVLTLAFWGIFGRPQQIDTVPRATIEPALHNDITPKETLHRDSREPLLLQASTDERVLRDALTFVPGTERLVLKTSNSEGRLLVREWNLGTPDLKPLVMDFAGRMGVFAASVNQLLFVSSVESGDIGSESVSSLNIRRSDVWTSSSQTTVTRMMELSQQRPRDIEQVGFSPSGHFAFTLSATSLLLWKTSETEPLQPIAGYAVSEADQQLWSACFVGDEALVAITHGQVLKWSLAVIDTETVGHPKVLRQAGDEHFEHLLTGRDATSFVVLDMRGNVYVWDAADNSDLIKKALSFWSGDIGEFSLSPDGRWLIAGDVRGSDGQEDYAIYQQRLWSPEPTILDQHTAEVIGIATTDKCVLSASKREVLFWNLSQPSLAAKLSIPEDCGEIKCITMSSASNYAAAADEKGAVLVWNLTPFVDDFERDRKVVPNVLSD